MSMYGFDIETHVISTCLGFLSAIAVQVLMSRIDNNRKYKSIRKNLLVELQRIEKEIDNMDKNKVYLNPYNIPVWIGIRESGSIKYIETQRIFLQLVDVFSIIEYRNTIETKCFEMCYGNNKYLEEAIMSRLNEGRNEVKKMVLIGINLLNE